MKRTLVGLTLTAAALIGTAMMASAAQAETVLRLLPAHTDAFTENYNPYNYSSPQSRTQDFAYEPLWIYNIWHPD